MVFGFLTSSATECIKDLFRTKTIECDPDRFSFSGAELNSDEVFEVNHTLNDSAL